MLDATDAFVAKRPDFPIKIGLYSFSSGVRGSGRSSRTIAPPFERAGHPAPPRGGTAIGDAMQEARPDLYRAGVFRKYLLVVTDGENTNGRPPDNVAREIFKRAKVLCRFISSPLTRTPRSSPS